MSGQQMMGVQQMGGQQMQGGSQPQGGQQMMGSQPQAAVRERRSKWDEGPGGAHIQPVAPVPDQTMMPAPVAPPNWDMQTINIAQEFIARWNLDVFSQHELYKC